MMGMGSTTNKSTPPVLLLSMQASIAGLCAGGHVVGAGFGGVRIRALFCPAQLIPRHIHFFIKKSGP